MAFASSWADFFAANEVAECSAAYAAMRRACGLAEDVVGRPAFDGLMKATLEAADVPHKMKALMQTLAARTVPPASVPTRLVVSGAGPVGLRAACEAALLGQIVHVVEKRDTFSRVNILMLWQQTADDLVAYSARAFFPKFSNRNIGDSPLHCGTREMQLIFLKNALLLGVRFSYGTELVGVQAPSLASSGGAWSAWARVPTSTATHQTKGGALDFKPLKLAEYSVGVGQGKCNLLQSSALDESFVARADAPVPDGVAPLPFDAMLLAEGEWSETCKRLGVTKSIDRFTQERGRGAPTCAARDASVVTHWLVTCATRWLVTCAS
jgi:hypothetical protein